MLRNRHKNCPSPDNKQDEAANNDFEVSLDDEELNLINGTYENIEESLPYEYNEESYNENGIVDCNDEPDQIYYDNEDPYTITYNNTPIKNVQHNSNFIEEDCFNNNLTQNNRTNIRKTVNEAKKFVAIRPKGNTPNEFNETGVVLASMKMEANQSVVGSPRKFIRKFNDEIRHELELKFLENNFISGVEKDRLATRLNLTERQVKKW